jgi:precorrin-2 dehydrogenase/sirohydrochlorin ferrochelatase
MDAFPAFFPLAGRRVVVVGSGEAADNKARLFDGSPATLARLSEDEASQPGAFDGAILAFIASEDEAFIVQAAGAARAAGAAVNVVDHPEHCDFYTPAVIDRGAVVAAVGATGAAPLLAAMLRNTIEAQVPEGAGRVAALFRATRDEVRAALPDIGDRRGFLRDALNGPAAQAALDGDMDAALALLREAIAALAEGPRPRPMGRVDFIVGAGPADLLSLRAARALSQADVLIADPRLPPEITAMARRDARRAPFADSATLKLAELAGDGLRVVCAVTGPLDPSVPRTLALTGAGVAVLNQASA